MLTAIAHETRLMVFRTLAAAGREISAGGLAEQLHVPSTTLSFHLKELANAQLVRSRRDGRTILYALDEGNVGSLMNYLLEDCCSGRPELCQPGQCCEPTTVDRTKRRRVTSRATR
jgi:ArsR family transcriptional regulator, arsenate/arsenite/antimonite-responsive transcriptional repressor